MPATLVRPVTHSIKRAHGIDEWGKGGYISYNCAKYQVQCTVDHCTAEEVAAGVWKWKYRAIMASECATIAMRAATTARDPYSSMPLRNVTCCTTPYCNQPDQAADNFTTVIQASEAANFSCYVNLAQERIMLGAAAAPLSVFAMSSPAVQYSRLWGISNPSDEGPSIHPDWTPAAEFYTTSMEPYDGYTSSEPAACAKFQYNRCALDTDSDTFIYRSYDWFAGSPTHYSTPEIDCSPEEKANGVWAWAYRRIAKADCMEMQLMAQGDGGNAPCDML